MTFNAKTILGNELTDEEAMVDEYSAVRTDSTGACFDSTASLRNKI